MAEAVLPVLLIGCGGVGRSLLLHIVSTRASHAAQGLEIAVTGVADSSAVVRATGQSRLGGDSQGASLSDAVLHELCDWKAGKRGLISFSAEGLESVAIGDSSDDPSRMLAGLLDLVEKQKSAVPGLVVVDCTASDLMPEVLAAAADMGCCLVMANKKALTGPQALYDRICAAGRRVRYEATVGAGLPILCQLSRMANAGDDVQSISGTMSGSLGYIMTALQDGVPFSTAVTRARELGFTEPDPRDDLSGVDVARKALILARHLGWRMEMQDVQRKGLVSGALEQLDVEEFMGRGLEQLEQQVAREMDGVRRQAGGDAESPGLVFRYVATVQGGRCETGLVGLSPDTPLGRLRGTDNLVEITSRCYVKGKPLVVQGAGAGNDTTAGAVLADIVDLRDLFVRDAGTNKGK